MSATGRAEGQGLYAALLLSLPGVGPARLQRIVQSLGSPAQAWQATDPQLARAAGLGPQAVSRWKGLRGAGRERELAGRLRRLGAQAVSLWDADYPRMLRLVPEPPPVLFVRGCRPRLSVRAVAVVGSRQADMAGVLAAERLAMELAAAGFTVVSGLAQGIDAAAHRGALRAGGCTVGVLGCGIDRVYPREHEELYAAVARAGALVSEYGPGVEPAPWQFAARNRIIAGLCAAVVVVEARARSGALATAQWAAELSREVLAVPGDVVRATCRGSNRLLAEGARVCLTVDDVVEAACDCLRHWGLEGADPAAGHGAGAGRQAARAQGTPGPAGPLAPAPGEQAAGLSPQARQLWQGMPRRPVELEELSAQGNYPVGKLLAWLGELEAAGLARRLADGRWLAVAGAQASSPLLPSAGQAYN
ncbi:MAG TPA: DNA-processing protein DprA [Limnochordales bacterium]